LVRLFCAALPAAPSAPSVTPLRPMEYGRLLYFHPVVSSEMCCMRLAGNKGRKNNAKNGYRRTIAQLS